MGKLTIMTNCAKEVLKKNKTLLYITGSAFGIGSLCKIVAKTLEKSETTKADYFIKGYKAGINVAVDAMEMKLKDPSKDLEDILREVEPKHMRNELTNK